MKINEKAAKILLSQCVGAREGESLLLLSDGNHTTFIKAVIAESLKMKLHPALLELSLHEQFQQEPPAFVADIFSAVDIVILLTKYPISRSRVCEIAKSHKTRIISLVNTDVDILERVVETNYPRVKSISQKLADILTIGSSLTLTTEAGTYFQLSLNKVKGNISAGMITNKGQISSLPAGETFCTPQLGSSDGDLLVDGSIDLIGPVKDLVHLKIREGVIRRISGNGEAALLRKEIKKFGAEARHIVGFGIGTNESARFGNSVHEDKKVLGSVHVSFGNTFYFDKSGRLPNRIDAVIKNPTLTIDGKKIIQNGELTIMYQ
jgi:leucyl aminopeptidase (aminopeptidase T)